MKKILIAFASVAVLLFSCKKSNTGNGSGPGNTPPPSSSSLLSGTTLVTYDTLSGSRVDSIIYSYGYDNQGRVLSNLSRTYTFSPAYPAGQLIGTDTTLVSYGTGTISVSQQTWFGALHAQTVLTTIYLHASAGQLADSSHKSTTLYSPAASTTLENWTYAYDGAGYLIHQDNYLMANGQEKLEADIVLSVVNGNTVSYTSTIYTIPGNPATAIPLITSYIFLDKVAPVVNYTGNSNNFIGFGSTILGHANINLVKS
ncbi:MAG TPA: hypothetical protein VE035_00665, partial [Puia sp.]|nr:hypothetical protein [Puia sp.]